jgi:hypothetical protein
MSENLNVNLYQELLESGKSLSITQLEHLLKIVKEILSREPNMPNVPAPVTIVGDIHG